jgi:hypothetical protein
LLSCWIQFLFSSRNTFLAVMKSTTFFDEDSNDGKCFIVQATTYLGIGSGTLFSVNINEDTDKVVRARTVPEYNFFPNWHIT